MWPGGLGLVDRRVGARPDCVAAACATIGESWGTRGSYLAGGVGRSAETRGRLRERLLDQG